MVLSAEILSFRMQKFSFQHLAALYVEAKSQKLKLCVRPWEQESHSVSFLTQLRTNFISNVYSKHNNYNGIPI
jgi:hypothetical protein